MDFVADVSKLKYYAHSNTRHTIVLQMGDLQNDSSGLATTVVLLPVYLSVVYTRVIYYFSSIS